jgi:aminoglycoside phosphotransferase (APT) family kinase protein
MRRLVPHLPRRKKRRQFAPRRPRYVVDIELDDGAQLVDRLRQQGLAPDEVVFKYLWPRYAPPPASGIQSLLKSENLAWQFERLVAMHRVVPSAIPLPVGLVRNASGGLVGYVLERIEGVTLQELLDVGAFVEARRQLAAIERTIAKLHAKSIAHGDLNTYNVIASDDGRTILIDPVASPGSGTMLQDELLLRRLRELIPG